MEARWPGVDSLTHYKSVALTKPRAPILCLSRGLHLVRLVPVSMGHHHAMRFEPLSGSFAGQPLTLRQCSRYEQPAVAANSKSQDTMTNKLHLSVRAPELLLHTLPIWVAPHKPRKRSYGPSIYYRMFNLFVILVIIYLFIQYPHRPRTNDLKKGGSTVYLEVQKSTCASHLIPRFHVFALLSRSF